MESDLFKRLNCLNLFNDLPFSQDITQAPYFNFNVLHDLASAYLFNSLPSDPHLPHPNTSLLTCLGPWPSFSSSYAKLLPARGLCACYSSIWHMLPLASSISSATDICSFCLPSTLSSHNQTPLFFFKPSLPYSHSM